MLGGYKIIDLSLRTAIPLVLLLVGVTAAAMVLVTDDVARKAIWVGVASTTITAGLVDGSGLLEARRREQAVLRLVGVRVDEIHRELSRIISTIFAATNETTNEVSATLRHLPREDQVLLSVPVPNMAPVRSKQDYVMQLVRGMDLALNDALSLGALTREAQRIERLDNVIRSGTFVGIMRTAVPHAPSLGFPAITANKVLAEAAADALDAVREESRFFASRSGSSRNFWK